MDSNVFILTNCIYIDFQPILEFDVKVVGWVGIFLNVNRH